METYERIIRKKEVLMIVGLSAVTIWRKEKKGEFPKRVKLGGNSVGWLKSEIDQWIATIAESRMT